MTFSREQLIAMCASDIREGVRRSAAEALYAMGQADCMQEVREMHEQSANDFKPLPRVDLIDLRVAQINPAYLTPQERQWMAEGEAEEKGDV